MAGNYAAQLGEQRFNEAKAEVNEYVDVIGFETLLARPTIGLNKVNLEHNWHSASKPLHFEEDCPVCGEPAFSCVMCRCLRDGPIGPVPYDYRAIAPSQVPTTRYYKRRHGGEWHVDIRSGLRSMQGAGSRTPDVKRATIPSSITRIEASTFAGCTLLTRVVVPPHVTHISRQAFYGCTSLTSVEFQSSAIPDIDYDAFKRCSSLSTVEITHSLLTSLLTSPAKSMYPRGREIFGICRRVCAAKPIIFIVTPNTGALGTPNLVFQHPMRPQAVVTPEFGSFAHFIEDKEDGESQNPAIAKIWAPDEIIAQLDGPFKHFDCLGDLPREMRAAPDATSWAGVQLWQWWLPPFAFFNNKEDGRIVCQQRRVMIWTVMLAAYCASEVLQTLPDLEPELWELIFTFVKHDQQPVLAQQLSPPFVAPEICYY